MASTDALPVPRKNVAYRLYFGIYKNDGTLITGAAGLDSEISKDGGTAADCTNEATEIATSTGMYYLDLTSTEMNADSCAIVVKTSSTSAVIPTFFLYPQETGDIKIDVQSYGGTAGTFASGIPEVKINLPVGSIPSLGIIDNGTLQSATSSTAVIRSAASFGDDIPNGMVIEITGGTGVGQSRLVVDYTGASDTVTVNPNWTTTPDNTSTYIIRSAPPAPTSATYMNTVLLSNGTGTGQLDFTSGVVKSNVTQFNGSSATSASGRPEVNLTHIAGSAVSTSAAQLGVNLVQVSSDATAADNLEAMLDGTGGVTLTTALTGNITGNLSGSVGSVTGSVGSVTGSVGGSVGGSIGSLAAQAKADVNAEVVDALAVDIVADSVPADGTRPTIAQAAYMLVQFMLERTVSGTTMTVKKPDGTTSLFTLTLNDSTTPTSLTRAT